MSAAARSPPSVVPASRRVKRILRLGDPRTRGKIHTAAAGTTPLQPPSFAQLASAPASGADGTLTIALEITVVAVAAVAAGMVNALAGGGTLITFPTLLAIGVPPVAANVTSTVALSPGYLGAALAQSADLRGQRARMRVLLPLSVLAGVAGSALLLRSGDELFRSLIPWLILAATALLALQNRVRAWAARRTVPERQHATAIRPGAVGLVIIAGVYGGYFGAGLGVILLAVLGLAFEDSLTRLNALKQSISLAVNSAATVYFLFSGNTVWHFAGVMAVGAVAGGVAGGRIAHRLPPEALRRTVVALGLAVGLYYLIRG